MEFFNIIKLLVMHGILENHWQFSIAGYARNSWECFRMPEILGILTFLAFLESFDALQLRELLETLDYLEGLKCLGMFQCLWRLRKNRFSQIYTWVGNCNNKKKLITYKIFLITSPFRGRCEHPWSIHFKFRVVLLQRIYYITSCIH